MRRKAVIMTFVLAATLLVTMPFVGMAVAEEHETDSNETEEEQLTLGERVSATMNVQERELEGDLEQRTVEREIAGADETERDEVIEQRLETLETDLENLEERAERLADKRESGEISEAAFHARMAELRVEAESKSELAERITRTLEDTEALEEQQETVEAIVELRVRASDVADQGDDERTREIIDPDPEASEEQLRDSAEEMGKRFAAVLERADRQSQERGEPVHRVVEFPDDVLDEQFTIAVADTNDGGTVEIDYVERNVSYTAEFASRAEVESNEIESQAVAYAATGEKISIRAADDDDDEREEPPRGSVEEVAEEIGDRTAETLEETDRRAQERNETVRNVAGFPEEIADEDYTIALRGTDSGGSVQVQTEEGNVTYTSEFSAETAVQSNELEGGPIVVVSDTDELSVGELDDDERERQRAERTAEDAGEQVAAILERADRRAQERATLVRGAVGLPEEIADEEYTIAVQDTETGGSVQIDVEDHNVTYMTEFAANASVDGATMSGGPVRYLADADELSVRGEPADDPDDADGQMAAEVGTRLAKLLEESDRQSERLDRQVRGGAGFPEELGTEEYSIVLRNTTDGGLVVVESEDGESQLSAEFTARGSVAETEVRGGPVRYTVSADGVSIAEFDDEREERDDDRGEDDSDEREERDDDERDEEEDDGDKTEEAREIAQRLSRTLEDTDREAHRTGETVTEELSLPDDIEDSEYRMRLVDTSDGGGIEIYERSDSSATLLVEYEFSAQSTVQAGDLAGGDVVVRSDGGELVVFGEDSSEEREDDEKQASDDDGDDGDDDREAEDTDDDEQEEEGQEDDDGTTGDVDDSDGSEEAAEIGDRLAETIVDVDRDTLESGEPEREDVDLPDDVGGSEYVVTVVSAEGGGIVQVRELSSDGTATLLYETEFGVDATVQDTRISGGGEVVVEASAGELTLSS